MRTTVTLDDDVAALVERERQEHGTSLKEVINQALRERYRPDRNRAPHAFRTRTSGLGSPRVNLDDVAEALDHAEGTKNC